MPDPENAPLLEPDAIIRQGNIDCEEII